MTGNRVTAAGSTPVHLEVPGDPMYIRLARLVGSGLANELGFDVDRLDDVRMAIGEACGLSVMVGAPSVHVEFHIDAGRLTVDVDADAPSINDDEFDEHVALARQLLEVLCSTASINRHGTAWRFRMTFDART